MSARRSSASAKERALELFDSGRWAAEQFLDTWDFDAYIAEYRSGKKHSRRAALTASLARQHRSSSCEDRRMPKPLWAPWRLEYVTHADEQTGCVLCAEAAGEVEETPRRPAAASAPSSLLNKFPYSSGHLLIAPYEHTGELEALDDETALEIHRLGLHGIEALRTTYAPGGFNLGWNLGRVAGAGIADHVHLHVVPRWAGDTSFMPVLGDVKVLPEHLLATRDRLRAAWPS